MHNIWLTKIYSYDIRDKTNFQFNSYLSGQTQTAEVNNCDCRNSVQNKYSSCSGGKKHGLSQASILGLISFLLCTNCLPLNIKEAELFLFADDTILVTSENVFRYKVYNVFNKLQSWFHTNILSLYAEKQQQCHSLLDRTEIC